MFTELGDQTYVGTALTLQLAIGYVLTVPTLWLIPIVRDAFSWGFAFGLLAEGPVVGTIAMRRLDRIESDRGLGNRCRRRPCQGKARLSSRSVMKKRRF